jgi:uncharacterized protein (TIRG00374 family)
MGERMKNFKKLKLVIKISLSIILMCWLLHSLKWNEFLNCLGNMNTFCLMPAILCIFLAIAVSVLKWKALLDAQNIRLSFKKLWDIYWAGQFFNNFLPSSIGGDGLRILWINKEIKDPAGSSASVVIERVVATLALALLALMATSKTQASDYKIDFIFYGLVAISILLILVFLFFPINKGNKSKNKLLCFLTAFAEHGEKLRNNYQALFKCLSWSLVFQLLNIGVNLAIFKGLAINISYWDAIYIIPATAVAAMLPIGINGYGVRESAYIFLLSRLGIPMGKAFTASLIYAFAISFCSLWGGIVWLLHEKGALKK